jgi:SAM-dependent methyltransferase
MENLAKGNWSDPERVRGFASTYDRRYGTVFWDVLREIQPRQTYRAVADFGCGPGLWLADAILRLDVTVAYGLDASQAMLDYAEEILGALVGPVKYSLKLVDFDRHQMPLPESSLDMGFSGYMFHEVADPNEFARMVLKCIRVGGVYVVFDFISGNPEEFIRQMAALGTSEENARKRYPHMCKHSLTDIENILKKAGFSSVKSKSILDTRAIVVAVKSK